jgi:hypothetical protein
MTRRILNKKKVAENAKKLGEAGVIALMAADKLSEMVRTCNCAPVKFIERLLTNGFDLDVINKLGIYEESPEMTETVQALLDFIERL